jgi:dihydrolipoamide dehydrogenase
MPAEVTMPQLSDTMTEGTVVKWHKKVGDKVRAGEEIADVETDKAVMPMEAFEGGTLAVIKVKEGEKVAVGGVLAVIASASENLEEVKKKFGGGGGGATAPAPAPGRGEAAAATPAAAAGGAAAAVKPGAQAALAAAAGKQMSPPVEAAPGPSHSPRPISHPGKFEYDIVVIGGGPAGYAAAIRAGQLKKKVLCIEKENLGGTCLNWGCIPTKALLEDGAFIRKMRTDAAAHGVSFDNFKLDFPRVIARSRAIADKLSKGIASLFHKYGVKSEMGTAQLIGAHKVRITGSDGKTKEVTGDHVIIAVGAKTTPLPNVTFDGRKILTSREAMTLPTLPRKLAIIGAGAIGCEFADFYNAVGTEVIIVEMLDHLLPNEDDDVARVVERIFEKRKIDIRTRTKTDKVETTPTGVKLTLSGGKPGVVEADAVLVAIGVTGNADSAVDPKTGLELFRGRVKATPDYRTNLENVWAVGDCLSLHWPEGESMGGYRHPDLAHVAHHEAVHVVEHIAGLANDRLDYRQIPGCTYTHPQVASMGYTEKRAREAGRELKIGKFPFSASGRALAAGEPDGFVKLIFDAKYGELLGVHMVGESVTDLLSELVLARKLEATEEELISAIHPHPTYSEAIMEAAGVAMGKAIHL